MTGRWGEHKPGKTIWLSCRSFGYRWEDCCGGCLDEHEEGYSGGVEYEPDAKNGGLTRIFRPINPVMSACCKHSNPSRKEWAKALKEWRK